MGAEPASLPKASDASIAGRYRVEELLAQGGAGAVFRALDESTGERVAIKQLLPDRLRSATHMAMFQREYRTLAGLRHPRIIRVFDYGHDVDGPYYTMELLSGPSLRDGAPLPYQTACKHLRDVASSLALLHARQLVHRDVSPANVRLGDDGYAKLLDFGALSPFGTAELVMGTPSCIAPESLEGGSLDARTDLYSLGALAYFVLTGEHAYPAKSFELLRSVLSHRPAPLSSIVPGVPRALEELVEALLNHDPMSRPSSAAEVIDRLNAIADLPPESGGEGRHSYLSSPTLVGRDQELRLLTRKLSRLEDHRGGTVLVEGPTGYGRTRLLRELGVEARLRGFAVLEVSASEHRGPYGVAVALGRAALCAMPQSAQETLDKRMSVLGAFFSRSSLIAPKAKQEGDQIERRLRTQAAFADWLTELSSMRAFVIAVDDVEQADPASVALLTALAHAAHDHELLLAISLRTAKQALQERALLKLRSQADLVRLRELHMEDTESLVLTMFGSAPNSGRLARWLHELGSGSPDSCMELVAHLVSKGVIRYVQGAWMLPHELDARELPKGIDQARLERLKHLSPAARMLAEALCLVRGQVSPALSHALALSLEVLDVAGATRELLSDGLLRHARDGVVFAHESLRETLVRDLSPELKKRLHKAIADALLAETSLTPDRMLEAGFHLIGAADMHRGAELLERGAEQLSVSGEGLREIAPALEAALHVYRKRGRTMQQCLPLLLPLIGAGQAADRRLVERYGDATFDAIRATTGLKLAEQLAPILGGRAATYIALFYAAVLFVLTPARYRVRSLRYHFGHSFGTAALLCGTYASLLDTKRVEAVVRGVQPLAHLPLGHSARFLFDMCCMLRELSSGRDGGCIQRLDLLTAQVDDPTQLADLDPAVKKRARGALVLTRGIVTCARASDAGMPEVSELEALDLSFYRMGAMQLRMVYHAHRGEVALATKYGQAVELLAVQGGSTWQLEIWMPTTLGMIYALTGDLIGIKRTVEQLDRLSEQLPGLRINRDLMRGVYAMRQGRPAEALAIFEAVFADKRPGGFPAWASATASYAEALNGCGQHRRAKALCEEAMVVLSDPRRMKIGYRDAVVRQFALSVLHVDGAGPAAALLDALIEELAPRKNPLQSGLAHRDRADVALLSGDRPGFEQHLRSMEECFRATGNPALVAQCDRMRARGVRAGFVPVESSKELSQLCAMLREHAPGKARETAALEYLMRATLADEAHYFALSSDKLELARSTPSGAPVSDALTERAHALLDGLRRVTDKTGNTCTETAVEATVSAVSAREQSGIQCVGLHVPERGRLSPFGVLVLRRSEGDVLTPSYKALTAIARLLKHDTTPRS